MLTAVLGITITRSVRDALASNLLRPFSARLMRTAHWQADLRQLKHLRLFHNIASNNLKLLLKDFRPCELEPGEVLLSPSRRNQCLYLLLKGQLEVRLDSLDHPAISTLEVGDCAGEVSFIDNAHPSAFVVANQPCLVLRLQRKAMLRLFSQSPQLTRNLMELLCLRVRLGNRLIIDSAQSAHIDSLTGSFNRRWLEHIFQRESTRCSYDNRPMSLLILDVDHFKAYNDKHGHLAGDYALCLVSNTLGKLLRTKDSLVRFGGEEFVILLPDMAREEAKTIGERLRKSLEALREFQAPCGTLPGVTVSIGLAQMQPGDSLEGLIGRADNALYRAKQNGRNQVCEATLAPH